MKKTPPIGHLFTVLGLVAASHFITTEASATVQIQIRALARGINITNCQTCHAGSAGRERSSDLKPNYLSAYLLDPSGLSRLKNLINGCPSGQVINPTTFLCAAATLNPKTVNGSVGARASGAARTDVYEVSCGTGTSSLRVSVRDNAPVRTPIVSIQATKEAASSALSQDRIDGDRIFSRPVTLAGGSGIYNMRVNKSATAEIGAETYTARFACINAAGVQTNTSNAVIKQNQ